MVNQFHDVYIQNPKHPWYIYIYLPTFTAKLTQSLGEHTMDSLGHISKIAFAQYKTDTQAEASRLIDEVQNASRHARGHDACTKFTLNIPVALVNLHIVSIFLNKVY